MIVHDLSPDAVRRMVPVELAGLTGPPPSPIGEFSFHDCVCGIGCFRGRPPWERHGRGDELIQVLAGEAELTILDDDGPVSRTLVAGDLVVIPEGRWHNNDAPKGVTMFCITPAEGNEHSWERPDTPSAPTS